MKGISPTHHRQLIDKAADLYQVFSDNGHPHALQLHALSTDFQQLYAEHHALLEALAQNIAAYNTQHSNLRKACRTATTIADKLRHEDTVAYTVEK